MLFTMKFGMTIVLDTEVLSINRLEMSTKHSEDDNNIIRLEIHHFRAKYIKRNFLQSPHF